MVDHFSLYVDIVQQLFVVSEIMIKIINNYYNIIQILL